MLTRMAVSGFNRRDSQHGYKPFTFVMLTVTMRSAVSTLGF